jgi:hypothetical protein
MARYIDGFTYHWWNDFQGDTDCFPDQNQWEIVEKGAMIVWVIETS